MKIYTYLIQSVADPEIPDEQPVGNEINDDRLFNEIVTLVNYNGQSYTKDFFFKNLASNKLTLVMPGMSFTHGTNVVVITK